MLSFLGFCSLDINESKSDKILPNEQSDAVIALVSVITIQGFIVSRTSKPRSPVSLFCMLHYTL